MKRPRYETENDLRMENHIRRMVEVAQGVSLQKLAPEQIFMWDYLALHKGQPFAFVEIKNRSHNYNTYPTLILSSKKVTRGISLVSMMDAKPYSSMIRLLVVAGFGDGVYYYEINGERNKSKLTISEGGRTDRNDKFDIEQVAHLPISDFHKLTPRHTAWLRDYTILEDEYLELRRQARQNQTWPTEALG